MIELFASIGLFTVAALLVSAAIYAVVAASEFVGGLRTIQQQARWLREDMHKLEARISKLEQAMEKEAAE